MFDGGGLYLEISPSGGKWWRFKYRFAGKEKRISLGVYPEVSLKEARSRRDEQRRLLASDIDPSVHRKAHKAKIQFNSSNTFESVAREWFSKQEPNWAHSHSIKIIQRLERDIFPWIGSKAVDTLSAPQILDVVRRIENRGALESAHRALANCSQVLRYAVATGRAERDPSVDLKGALPPVKGKHFAALIEPGDVGNLLRTLDGYEGTLVVQSALRLAPLVFVRPGELRRARWADIDLDAKEWRFTVTKTYTQHIVPLSRQAVEILGELKPLTGNGEYVFPSARSPRGDRPMSDNAVLAAMRSMGISKDEMSGHGFRAMARTMLEEVLGYRPELVEHQLAHQVRDPNGRAYNRTSHLTKRKEMMQAWADYLESLRGSTQPSGQWSKKRSLTTPFPENHKSGPASKISRTRSYSSNRA